MKSDIKELHEKVDTLMSNHLPHIQIEVTKTKVNVDWLMKMFWLVATASIGALISSLSILIFK